MPNLISSYAAWLAKVFAVPSPFPPSPLTIAKTQEAMGKAHRRGITVRGFLSNRGIPIAEQGAYQAAAAEMQTAKGQPGKMAGIQAKWSSPGYGLSAMTLKQMEQFV